MEKGRVVKFLVFLLILSFILNLSGCATIPTAIEYSDLQVKVKMTDTIFLDPILKAKHKKVFLAVANTSDLQEIDPTVLKNALAEKLIKKGYTIVNDPEEASFIIQTNILYMDYYRQTGAREGGLEGALAGAGAGAYLGRGSDSRAVALALIGAVVGEVGGAMLGKVIKVETYAGVVDVEIREKTDKPVIGQIVTNATLGTATTLQTKQEVSTNWQVYRTKIAATAQRTNINKEEAAKVIIDRLSTQIANIF
jgi:hypothetical protein